MLMQSVFAILDLSREDHLERDVRHASVEFLNIVILPPGEHFLRRRSPTL
jgi:hypothetical protein